MSNFSDAFGRKIRSARQKKGLTQAAFAELVDVKPATVSRWETGEFIPSEDKLIAIEKVLGNYADIFEAPPEASPNNELKEIAKEAAFQTIQSLFGSAGQVPDNLWPKLINSFAQGKDVSEDVVPKVVQPPIEPERQILIDMIMRLKIDSLPGAKRMLDLVFEAEAMAEAEIAAAESKQVAPKLARTARK